MNHKFMLHSTIPQGRSVTKLIATGYNFSQYFLNEDTKKAVAVLENTLGVVVVYPDDYKDFRSDKSIELIKDF